MTKMPHIHGRSALRRQAQVSEDTAATAYRCWDKCVKKLKDLEPVSTRTKGEKRRGVKLRTYIQIIQCGSRYYDSDGSDDENQGVNDAASRLLLSLERGRDRWKVDKLPETDGM